MQHAAYRPCTRRCAWWHTQPATGVAYSRRPKPQVWHSQASFHCSSVTDRHLRLVLSGRRGWVTKFFMLAPQRQRGLTFHKLMHAAKTVLCASDESEARSNFQRTFQSTSFPPSQPALVQTEGQSRWGNPSGLSQSLNQKAKGSWVHKEKHGMT